MKYRIILFTEGDLPGDLISKVLLSSDSAEGVRLATAAMVASAINQAGGSFVSARPGAPGRPVVVVSVDEEAEGAPPPSSWPPGRAFESASAAARALHRKDPTTVSRKLAQAATQGEATAIINGVEFCYTDQRPGASTL